MSTLGTTGDNSCPQVGQPVTMENTPLLLFSHSNEHEPHQCSKATCFSLFCDYINQEHVLFLWTDKNAGFSDIHNLLIRKSHKMIFHIQLETGWGKAEIKRGFCCQKNLQ